MPVQYDSILYSATVKNVTNHWAATLLIAVVLVGCGDSSATPTAVPTSEPPKATNVVAPTVAPAESTAAPTIKVSVPNVSGGNADSGKPLVSPLTSPIQAQAIGAAAPKQRSVWNTTIGTDHMTGDCKASVLPVYGLVQITPESSDTLTWKTQEPKPYTMNKITANQFQYVGPSVINDGVVTMTVTFVDDKNFSMMRDFVAKNTPGCNHHHDYAGVFQWNK